MEKIKIADGVYLSRIEDKKFKTSTCLVAIHTKLTKENATKNALLPLVLKRGTQKNHTFDEIEKALASLFGAEMSANVIKRGEDQLLIFDISFISDAFAPQKKGILKEAASLLFETVFDPYTENGAFKKEYVEAEKTNLKDMIKAQANDKQTYAITRLYEEMFSEEDFSVSELGNLDDVDSIDEKSLYEHYLKLISCARVDIFIAGGADFDPLIESAKEALLKVKRENVLSYPEHAPHKKREEVKRVTERLNVNQAKLSLGFSRGPLSEDEYYSFIVANSIFGSGVHSKLFNNVREKLSLAYYAFSRTERVKNAVIVGMGIEEENFKKAYDETLYQLEALKRGEISDDEFNGAVMFLKNNARAVLDSQGAMIMYNLSNCALGLDVSVDEYIKKIDEVTKKSCAESFKDLTLDTVYFLCGKENENA